MGKAKKGKKNPSADDGDSDVETTNIDSVKPAQKGKKIPVESDESESEKPKAKAKHKKSIDEDVKEVTKNIKNVSISNKSQKKKDISSEDESDEEPEQKTKKNKKKDEKRSTFALLEIEDADVSPPEAPPSSDDEETVKKPKQKSSQEKKEPAGKKGKKSKRKKDDSDDDIEKVLAELEMEYAGVKKEPSVVPDADKPVEATEEKSKSKKKGKKDEPKTEPEKDAEEDHASDNENDVTIKTAAQKKKEKKEREKLKKQEAKKKEKEQENKQELTEKKQAPKTTEKIEDETSKADISQIKVDSEEKDGEGDTPVTTEGSKKKKKGDKGEKEDKTKKGGPTKKTIAAMQEALKKVKEEEERLQKEEEERIKQEEERERQRLEAIRLEKEKKDRKKQKEKERKERLKAEGKLLTPKQKAEKARAQALLESLKAQGVEIGSAEKKPPRPGTRIKPQRLKSQLSQDAPTTPIEDKKMQVELEDKKEESPKLEEKKKESEDESVKDAWDAESSEEEAEPSKPEPVPSPTKEEKKSEQDKAKENEDDESSEDDDEETSDEDSSSDEDSDDDQMTDVQKKRELILKRLEKRREENEANKGNNPLRAAVVCVLGHVDTGKTKILDKLRRTNVQDGEAGGITQQIGATNVPIENIKEQTKHVKGVSEILFKLPGLLIIDTPGHESFSNLRNRGSSLCDIAILVVDIMHGLEPQTIESINMLKQKKTPFIVALNKIDRLYDWQSAQRKDVRDILKMQQANTQLEFDKRSKDVILQFAEQGLNAALFYENPDPRTYVSLVPTSAVTGEGMGNLLAMIVQACEGPLHKRLVFSQQLLATVLEVKAIPGLGTTIDTILINGTLREGDTMVLAGTEGPIVTQIRSLLMPQPMKELRVKNAYIEHKEVIGAQGVKIAAKELEKSIAGLNLLVAQKPDEVDVLKEEVARELKTALSSIKLSERGVYVQASTLGSLEALLEFLRTSKIPYSAIRIGPVVKRDVMKASAMLEHDSQYATILAFDVKIERDAQEMADQLGVKIFAADIIYHLFDKFTAYREELKQKKREEFKHIAVFPCKLKVLPQFVFNSRDPIVAGVMVEAGIVKEGTPICVPSKEFVELGIVTSIEVNHKQVESARKGQEVCIKIDPIPGESPKMFGRHFDETDMLISKISRASIDACKDYFRDDLIKTDWQLMVELKKLFQIL
ncbi:eukaryotic translation initiation factor 5B [Achroia grisella]|uniref:eukaryotic translation initiation factor 5B n=1 Tax=Achroia grisella TaxID=688607 RepID=UPI0027D2EA6D|nr:eukaryotic translation initiation factor 5B [Achroia grisella]